MVVISSTCARRWSWVISCGYLTPELLDSAGSLPGSLRSFYAIHLVTALRLRASLYALVAYDQRLIEAAELAGLPTVSPGQETTTEGLQPGPRRT